jgi:hypothetical protein
MQFHFMILLKSHLKAYFYNNESNYFQPKVGIITT